MSANARGKRACDPTVTESPSPGAGNNGTGIGSRDGPRRSDSPNPKPALSVKQAKHGSGTTLSASADSARSTQIAAAARGLATMREEGSRSSQGMWDGVGPLTTFDVDGIIGFCDFVYQLRSLTLRELCTLTEALGGRELSAIDHEAIMRYV